MTDTILPKPMPSHPSLMLPYHCKTITDLAESMSYHLGTAMTELYTAGKVPQVGTLTSLYSAVNHILLEIERLRIHEPKEF